MFDPVLFVFLNRARNRVKILYWELNGFCLWLKRLEAERFKAPPEPGDEAIVMSARELNRLLDGFDLWRNRSNRRSMPPRRKWHCSTRRKAWPSRSRMQWMPAPSR